jgi:hypothetical protein
MARVLNFIFERETKGAVRYKEVDGNKQVVAQPDAVLGTFYIRKSALNGTIPKGYKVTLEES